MKKFVKISAIVSSIMLVIVVYTVYDNNRFIIKEEVIKLENLPSSFEGFTILQISDLHEKRFGDNQEKLLKSINSLPYDAIAFTGDMQSINSEDKKPFMELLQGIENREYMFYVSGNHGPVFSNELLEQGCIPLDKPYEIKSKDGSMVFYDFYNGVDFSDDIKSTNGDVNIAITHYPWDGEFYSNSNDSIGKYDLVVAGHYHGGQIRIPFYGALYIPNINKGIFFPEQSDVSGFQKYGSYKQYISRGLGASGDSFFSGFRLFNTPEINLIKLVKK